MSGGVQTGGLSWPKDRRFTNHRMTDPPTACGHIFESLAAIVGFLIHPTTFAWRKDRRASDLNEIFGKDQNGVSLYPSQLDFDRNRNGWSVFGKVKSLKVSAVGVEKLEDIMRIW